MGHLLCRVLPFINRGTPWTAFPSVVLSMSLTCQEGLPPAYIYRLLLWWACHGCLIAMKYHLREGLLSFCYWSALMPWTQKGFAQPEPVRCWLPGPVSTDCHCFPAVSGGSFSSYLLKAVLPGQLCVCSSAGWSRWWPGADRSCLLPLCLSHWNLISRATGAWDAPPGILLRWLLCPVLLVGLEKSLGKLIRWSDENGGSPSPTPDCLFFIIVFALGFLF